MKGTLSHYVNVGEKRGSMFIIFTASLRMRTSRETVALNRAQQEQRNGASFMKIGIGTACEGISEAPCVEMSYRIYQRSKHASLKLSQELKMTNKRL